MTTITFLLFWEQRTRRSDPLQWGITLPSVTAALKGASVQRIWGTFPVTRLVFTPPWSTQEGNTDDGGAQGSIPDWELGVSLRWALPNPHEAIEWGAARQGGRDGESHRLRSAPAVQCTTDGA